MCAKSAHICVNIFLKFFFFIHFFFYFCQTLHNAVCKSFTKCIMQCLYVCRSCYKLVIVRRLLATWFTKRSRVLGVSASQFICRIALTTLLAILCAHTFATNAFTHLCGKYVNLHTTAAPFSASRFVCVCEIPRNCLVAICKRMVPWYAACNT